MIDNIILIPVYNDWKSLNKLLIEINDISDETNLFKVLIINDSSTQKVDIERKKLHKIKQIKILSLKQNLGSQKSICVGLSYLKEQNNNSYITIMDGDGEDNPVEISKMLTHAKADPEYIITSHRKSRNENFIIKFSYKIHLIITFFLTWHWISFGNFSCFHSKNLKKLNLNDAWYAHSASVLKNCNIKKLYASRQKRYFENSKISFLKLIEHSLRITSVFYKKVFFNSLIFLILIWFFPANISFFFYMVIIFINLLILFIKLKHYTKISMNFNSFIKAVTEI